MKKTTPNLFRWSQQHFTFRKDQRQLVMWIEERRGTQERMELEVREMLRRQRQKDDDTKNLRDALSGMFRVFVLGEMVL